MSLDAPYYHCISRHVRRTLLCSHDTSSEKPYERRIGWIEERVPKLADSFSTCICVYAIMSNQYHIVLHTNQSKTDRWTDIENITRLHQINNA